MKTLDEKYLGIFLSPLYVCADYRPAFGTSGNGGLSLADFRSLYGSDEFYSWIGLDSPLVYAAHKASGGLTSIYRQIGVGVEQLLREIIKDGFSLEQEQVEWKYEYNKTKKQAAFHILDARISLDDLTNGNHVKRVTDWLKMARDTAHGDSRTKLRGAIFEIRQGYKSADSKRQNADLRFGARAYQNGHLPVVAILSSQVSEAVIGRYRNAGMLVLTGLHSNDPTVSTFAFFKEVVGYNLEHFFIRTSPKIKEVIHSLIEKLLTP
ncbi:MAG: hypothetical protein ACI4RA_00380 [Kiritimatiellia bacterium]